MSSINATQTLKTFDDIELGCHFLTAAAIGLTLYFSNRSVEWIGRKALLAGGGTLGVLLLAHKGEAEFFYYRNKGYANAIILVATYGVFHFLYRTIRPNSPSLLNRNVAMALGGSILWQLGMFCWGFEGYHKNLLSQVTKSSHLKELSPKNLKRLANFFKNNQKKWKEKGAEFQLEYLLLNPYAYGISFTAFKKIDSFGLNESCIGLKINKQQGKALKDDYFKILVSQIKAHYIDSDKFGKFPGFHTFTAIKHFIERIEGNISEDKLFKAFYTKENLKRLLNNCAEHLEDEKQYLQETIKNIPN